MNEADPMSMTVLNRTHVMLFLSGPLAAADMVLVFLNLCSNIRLEFITELEPSTPKYD